MNVAELSEADQIASKVYDRRKSSPEFCYNHACLMSRTGDTRRSLESLAAAIRQGFNDIAEARRDPKLAGLRKGMAKAFDELTAVKAMWNIVWGVFNDDITLTNNSAFALTNVTLAVRLEQDQRVWDPSLAAEVILPGQTQIWSNVVSVPGSRLTKSSATIACDQNKDR
jgi:hypothetical protein